MEKILIKNESHVLIAKRHFQGYGYDIDKLVLSAKFPMMLIANYWEDSEIGEIVSNGYDFELIQLSDFSEDGGVVF